MNSVFGFYKSLMGPSPVSRIRRNHGLEHATLHILADKFPKKSLAGHSDAGGFWILGDVEAEDLQSAVSEALSRMQNGEAELAVHPNCGTNFVTAGTFAGLAAWAAMFGVGHRLRDRLERIPLAASLATMALMVAQPMGLVIQQRLTTSGCPDALEVVDVLPTKRGRVKAHRVITRG